MKIRTSVAIILLSDICWIITAFAATVVLRYGTRWNSVDQVAIRALMPFLITTVVLWLFLSLGTKVDGFRGGWHFPAVVSRVFIAVAVLMGTLFAAGYVLHDFVSRLALGYFGGLLFVGFVWVRYGVRLWLRSQYRKGYVSRVVIIGSGRVAQELAVKIGRHPEMLCRVVGFLCPQDSIIEDPSVTSSNSSSPVSLSAFGTLELLRERTVDQVIVALSQPSWPEVLNLIAKCREYGITTNFVPQPYELYLSKPALIDLDGLPVLQLQTHFSSPLSLFCKRTIDVVLGGMLGLVALPVVLGVALVLKRSKGQAFGWETRCGQHGKVFRMLRLNVHRGGNHASLFEHVVERLSITELPQLWNVVTGEMSLVGPRPETTERVKHYSEWQQERLSVKPGMTGLAQVHGLREQNSSEEKTRFDLQYRLNPSLFADCSLLLQTIWTLAMRVIRFTRLRRTLPDAIQPVEIAESSDLMEVLSSAHSAQPSAD